MAEVWVPRQFVGKVKPGDLLRRPNVTGGRIPEGASPKSSGPDMVRAMSTELFLDFLGIRMDSKKAEGIAFTMNLVTPDNGEKFAIELSNATLTNIPGFVADDPDLTITINRTDLETVMMGDATPESQIIAGKCKLDGDPSVLAKLGATMVDFEFGFEIMAGTKSRAVEASATEHGTFEAGQLKLSGGK